MFLLYPLVSFSFKNIFFPGNLLCCCVSKCSSLNRLIQIGPPISRIVKFFLDCYLISMIRCCPKIIVGLLVENNRQNFLSQLESEVYRLFRTLFRFFHPEFDTPHMQSRWLYVNATHTHTYIYIHTHRC